MIDFTLDIPWNTMLNLIALRNLVEHDSTIEEDDYALLDETIQLQPAQ